MADPAGIGERSTSSSDSASTSLDGFMLSISGQAMAPAPIDRRGAGDQLQEVPFGDVRPRAVGRRVSGRRHGVGHPFCLAARILHGQVRRLRGMQGLPPCRKLAAGACPGRRN